MSEGKTAVSVQAAPGIAIIGGGNLGISIAEGLITRQFCVAENITVTRRNPVALAPLAQMGVSVSTDNAAAVASATYIILAVKPFQAAAVLETLKDVWKPGQVLISVVTGVWLRELETLVPPGLPIFRVMPNTAISIGESMSCICYQHADDNAVSFVQLMFNQLGKTVIIEESLMDAATVLGACGTAYAMRFIRANIQGGIEIGFSAATASLIAAQTIKGAAELILTKNTHPEAEIDKVTTPKGCTIAGLNEMEHQGFSSSLIKGISASYRKITGA